MEKELNGKAHTSGTRVASEQETRKRQVLSRCPTFAGLTSELLAEVLRKSTLVRFQKRKALYERGEQASAIFVIASGRARVVRRSADGRDVSMGYRTIGDVLGEWAALDDGPHLDSVLATDVVEAVRVPAKLVQRLVETVPSFAVKVFRVVAARRAEAEARIEAILSRTVESRLADFLLEGALAYGIPESRGTLIGVKYTHQEMADFVGATRETITLTLGDLKRRGLLTFDHRRIVLLDADGLRQLKAPRAEA